MPEIGTYSSSYFAWTPWNIIPEPGDPITYGWFDAVAQWTQRFIKIATVMATVNGTVIRNSGYGRAAVGIGTAGTYDFDYSSLRCDYHPPYLKFYVRESSIWNEFASLGSWYATPVDEMLNNNGTYSSAYFQDIGLGSARFVNNSGSQLVFYMVAYI